MSRTSQDIKNAHSQKTNIKKKTLPNDKQLAGGSPKLEDIAANHQSLGSPPSCAQF
jgi:hypothetical protein